MSIEQLPPIVKAFIGYTPYIEPKFNVISAYNNGMSISKIALNLDTSSQEAQKKINNLIERGLLTKRKQPNVPKRLPTHIKAQAVYMMNLGATLQQASDWIKKVSEHVPDKSLMNKWQKQKSVQKALQKLEQEQATKH